MSSAQSLCHRHCRPPYARTAMVAESSNFLEREHLWQQTGKSINLAVRFGYILPINHDFVSRINFKHQQGIHSACVCYQVGRIQIVSRHGTLFRTPFSQILHRFQQRTPSTFSSGNHQLDSVSTNIPRYLKCTASGRRGAFGCFFKATVCHASNGQKRSKFADRTSPRFTTSNLSVRFLKGFD